MNLRERLIELRKRLGLTRTEFAAKIGVSAAYIHILESGKQEITLRVLESISKSFEIPITYFFENINLNDENKIELKKYKINYLINQNKELIKGEFGEIYLPKRQFNNKYFIIKYLGENIPQFELNKGNFIVVSKEDELYNQDKLIVQIGKNVKFCILCIKRGNYILLPENESDFSFILDENKMNILKINKIVSVEE
ncbi:MAG: helix-turn-helix domain-containing protein [Caldisericia bacterium]|nr:helix-turn-helix domain-containing protein [Caldisericia bacterium]